MNRSSLIYGRGEVMLFCVNILSTPISWGSSSLWAVLITVHFYQNTIVFLSNSLHLYRWWISFTRLNILLFFFFFFLHIPPEGLSTYNKGIIFASSNFTYHLDLISEAVSGTKSSRFFYLTLSFKPYPTRDRQKTRQDYTWSSTEF